MNSHLVLALDYQRMTDALAVVDELKELVSIYKVGLELYLNAGNAILDALKQRNKKIFLDLKLHDITNTTKQAFHYILSQNVYMTTVHLSSGFETLRSLEEMNKSSQNRCKIIGVSVLTNLDSTDTKELYNEADGHKLANTFSTLASKAGLSGIVCSAREAAQIRERFGTELELVCPGIRLEEDCADDQKRICTPFEAVRAGANYLVLGRSVINAADKRAKARKILEEMEKGA